MFTKKYKSVFLLSLLFLVSCYEQERNCADFKTGKFESEIEIDGKKLTTTFERNDSIQTESYNNSIDMYSIRWTNDCEYVVKNIHPKNRAEKKAVQFKILTTNANGYTFEYSFVGEAKKHRGTVTKTQ
ncbi:MAG: DNA topoisomerase IV [Flavobacterium sp.]|nr:DNA topoisomerase IV [Flavobacterium sp.]